jgi:hypothetical protein
MVEEVPEAAPHALRVAYAAAVFPFMVPVYVVHELAHSVAVLPWGGPSGFYLIFDKDEEGVLRRIPIGAAVSHRDLEGRPEAFVTLAPLLLNVPAAALFAMPGDAAMVAGAVLGVAGLTGIGDLMSLLDHEKYVEDFGLDTAEHRLVVDATRLGLGGGHEPERTMSYGDAE